MPETVDGLVVADKAISVSNVANGTTRLQPVVLLTGQAAGALAALAARQGREPRAVPVRDVQQALLEAKAFLLPYLDVPPDHPQFARIQRVGATGILKGRGLPHAWANQTWFYPDFPLDAATLAQGLAEFEKVGRAAGRRQPAHGGGRGEAGPRLPGGPAAEGQGPLRRARSTARRRGAGLGSARPGTLARRPPRRPGPKSRPSSTSCSTRSR